MADALLSICIPTYNRPELLDFTLEGLREFERFGMPFEIVVSDNGDQKPARETVENRRRSMPYLRYCLQTRPVKPYASALNAIRNASGEFSVCLADDDSLIFENLVGHVRRMQREPDLVAIYADWIAYDDEKERDLHRYFRFQEPACFGPEDPIGLVNFVLNNAVLPETAVFRRDAFLKSDCIASRSCYPFFQWMYSFSRLGRAAFDLCPFYREHRILKPQFRRGNWSNMEMRLHLIGDEFRNLLENLFLRAIQDAGLDQVPDDQMLTARQLIDHFLHIRVPLEVERAIGEKNWLLATDLRRRMILWHGPGSRQQQESDVMKIVLPAALQAVREYYRLLSDVRGVRLCGFRSPTVKQLFCSHFPDVPLVEPSELAAEPPCRDLVLFRDAAAAEGSPASATDVAYSFRLDHLLDTYRVNRLQLDLDDL